MREVPTRHRPAERRPAYTFPIEFVNGSGQVSKFLVTISTFADMNIMEAFVENNKVANDLHALARDAAIMLSISCQYGIPLRELQGSFSRNEDNSPQSLLGALVDGIINELVTSPQLLAAMKEFYDGKKSKKAPPKDPPEGQEAKQPTPPPDQPPRGGPAYASETVGHETDDGSASE